MDLSLLVRHGERASARSIQNFSSQFIQFGHSFLRSHAKDLLVELASGPLVCCLSQSIRCLASRVAMLSATAMYFANRKIKRHCMCFLQSTRIVLLLQQQRSKAMAAISRPLSLGKLLSALACCCIWSRRQRSAEFQVSLARAGGAFFKTKQPSDELGGIKPARQSSDRQLVESNRPHINSQTQRPIPPQHVLL